MDEGIYQQAGDDAIQIGRARDVYIWTAATAPTRPEFKRYLRMLAVVSAPMVGLREADPPPAPLDLWAEWRRLEEAIRNAWDVVRGQGAPWAMVRLNPPTRHALADALASNDPGSAYQVVHFSGHGMLDGLAFEDDLGRTDFVTSDELVALFRERPIQLVVLNACQTEAIARRLHEEAGVPAVVATTEGLRDDEAHLLTARLYAWLARGQSVPQAFAEARSALRRAYERGELLIPLGHAADPEAYIAERLAAPLLLGDARLDLPPEDERAEEPFITLAEPPSRGVELRLAEDFVGRGPELVQVARWLRDRPSPVIALSGLGGIGKSALAAMAVLRGSWRFRAVVALSAREDPHLRPDALVPPLDSVLGRGGELASVPTEAERLARAIAALNGTPTLLVLDNLEDLTKAATRAWTDFLGRLDPRRGSVAILTLRPAVKHPLTDLAGSAHLPLERLGEPDALRLLADGLADRDLWGKVPSVDKLTLTQRGRLERLARRAYLTWLPLVLLAALDDLAGRAGRHPLALRLALGDLGYPHVSWAKALANVSDLRGRDWETQAEAMVGRMVADLAQADPEAVALLQTLLVFQGGATYEALRMVAIPEAAEVAFDDRLRAAVDASLLEGRGSGEAARYDLHPLTRTYLNRQRLPAPAALTELRRRYAAYFLDLTHRLAGRHWDTFDLVDLDLRNILEAMQLCEQLGKERELVEFMMAMGEFLLTRGYWNEHITYSERAIEACKRLPGQPHLGSLSRQLGRIYYRLGDYTKAERVWKVALNAFSVTNDRQGVGTVLYSLGALERRRDNFERAREMCRQSLRIMHSLGDRYGIATALYNLGFIELEDKTGDLSQAQAYFEQCLPIYRELAESSWVSRSLVRLGQVAAIQGRHEDAHRILREAREEIHKTKDRRTFVELCLVQALMEEQIANYEEAFRLAQDVWMLADQLGMKAELEALDALISRLCLVGSQ